MFLWRYQPKVVSLHILEYSIYCVNKVNVLQKKCSQKYGVVSYKKLTNMMQNERGCKNKNVQKCETHLPVVEKTAQNGFEIRS